MRLHGRLPTDTSAHRNRVYIYLLYINEDYIFIFFVLSYNGCSIELAHATEQDSKEKKYNARALIKDLIISADDWLYQCYRGGSVLLSIHSLHVPLSMHVVSLTHQCY